MNNQDQFKIQFDFYHIPSKLLPSNCGAYILTHLRSKAIYIGSSGDLTRRVRAHRSLCVRGINPNKGIQEAYNSDPRFNVLFILTPTREEGYDLEQELIDQHKRAGFQLLNVSLDSRVSGLGHTVTEGHREKLRQMRSGIQVGEETREKLRTLGIERMEDPSIRAHLRKKALQQWECPKAREAARLRQLGRKRTPEAIRNMVDGRKHLFKPVVVEGVTYDNLREASRALNTPYSTLKHRCESKNPLYKECYFVQSQTD